MTWRASPANGGRPVGRDAELERLCALLDGIHDRGGSRVITGDPGIGKTALLREVVREAEHRGISVLSASGAQAEAHLPFAALHQLVGPLLPRAAGLPDGHRHAVLHAFGIATGAEVPQPFHIALAVLELIADAAAVQPLLLVCDDVQWMDPASVEVIEFVARRVEDERAVMLLATRGRQPDPTLPEITLLPLDRTASRTVLREVAPDLPRPLTQAVLRHAGGIPLALVELPVAWRDGGADVAAPEEDAPLTARLERAFMAKVGELDERTATLLTVAALQDGDSVPELLDAAGQLLGEDLPPDALDAAAAAGLVDGDGAHLRFRHPLVRSAVRHSVPLARKHQIHDALARSLADPDRAAWHRAAATVPPDETVAALLDDAARRVLASGAAASAQRWLERAAELSADDSGRAQRLLAAGELAFQQGRYDDVQRLIRAVGELNLGGPERARLLWLEGAFDDGDPGDVDGVRRLVESAARARDDDDADLAVLLLMGAGRRCWWGALDAGLCTEVLAIAEGLGFDDADPRLVNIRALVAPFTRGAAALKTLRDWVARDVPDPMVAALLGVSSFVLGDFDRSLVFCSRAADGLRNQGRLALLAQVLVLQGWAALFLGRWDVTGTAVDEARRLTAETRQPGWEAIARLAQANLAARQGAGDATAELVLDAERVALMTGSTALLNGVEMARGIAALGEERTDVAFHHLGRMMDPAGPAYHYVERLWQIGDFAEAAHANGQEEQARAILAELEDAAAEIPSPGIARAVAYARAVLADDDEVEERISQALSIDGTITPWYRARLDLLRGIWLRRQRRVRESRDALLAAHAVFTSLGARAWAARAERELRAAGHRTDDGNTPIGVTLSPQELQIAQLAAQGLTNREIAQRLYLSHRTVASHLYRMFPKLGITNRAQLHGKLAGTVP